VLIIPRFYCSFGRRSTSNGTEVNSTQMKNTEALFKLYEDPEVMNTQGKIALQNALADHGKRFDTACTAARCAFDALVGTGILYFPSFIRAYMHELTFTS
jgi:hypothetical protein